jgi:nicotinate-nucleotide adenylyltransferase
MTELGILGGTFDPPHNGHLLLAESARVQFHLDRVVLMPAGDPYRKANRAVSATEHRVAMTRLATQDNPRFSVDDREAQTDGPTYTVNTLEELARDGVHHPLFILGADALRDMPNWHQPATIVELAQLVIAGKGASRQEIADAAAAAGFVRTPAVVDMPELAISSTLIRSRVAAGLPIRYLLPRAVEDYIHDQGLFRPQSQAASG